MKDLRDKKIIILGGTGTLGKAIARLLVNLDCNVQATIFSRDEVKQLEMMRTFPESPSFRYILGDVRDLDRLQEVLKGVDFVVHCAAIKHVVMAEKNPDECYKTNVLGTENVAKACLFNGIKKAVLISTDKAENPVGVYGKSKKEAESKFLEHNLTVVRLGNIVGARGSMWEAFKEQRSTGTLRVTHEDATRFYIEDDKAAQFVIQSLLDTKEGQISYPSMRSLRVIDLAKSIAPECDIEIIGLRPGDKVHEELGGNSSADFVEKQEYLETI